MRKVNFNDYIPLWSTYTNGKEILQKIFHLDQRTSEVARSVILSEHSPPSNTSLEERGITQIKDKGNTRRIVALFPFVGNLMIAIYDLTSSLFHSYKSNNWAKEVTNDLFRQYPATSPTIRSFLGEISSLDGEKRNKILSNLYENIQNFPNEDNPICNDDLCKIICFFSRSSGTLEDNLLDYQEINEGSKKTIQELISKYQLKKSVDATPIENDDNQETKAISESEGAYNKDLTPYEAIKVGDYETIRFHLNKIKENPSKDAPPLFFNEEGSIIHLLVKYKHTDVLEKLLNEYSDLLLPYIKRNDTTSVIPKNGEGMTPFHLAAHLGNTSALELLQKRGVDVNELSPDKKNVFHFAILGNQENVLLLARLGCLNFEQRDVNFKAPIDYAKENTSNVGVTIYNQILWVSRKAAALENPQPSFVCFPPENLVFEGEGAKEIAFIGAIKELERLKKLSSLKRVTGTASGVIVSALLATGHSASEISEILINSSLTPGNWIEEHIAKKTKIPNCTFGELKRLIDQGKPYRHLHVFVPSLESTSQRFSSEDPNCSEIVIADAIRASMSLPGVFRPTILRAKSADNRLDKPANRGSFLAGGAGTITAFDQKKYTTSALLSEEEGSESVQNNRTLCFSLFSNRSVPSNPANYKHRVIQIDNMGAGALELDMSPEKQQELIDSGRKATLTFFSTQSLNSILSRQVHETLPGTGIVQLRPQCSFFVRRKDIFEALEEILLPITGLSSSSAASGSTSPISKVVLTGDSGIGKSEIATYFAHSQLRKFPTIGWIHASTKQSLYQSYQSLATQLEIKITLEETLEELVAKVNAHLKNYHPQRFLLIFDDANSDVLPATLLPDSGNGAIIITTRQSHDYRGDLRTEIKSFSQDEATALIDKVMPGENLEIKKQIVSKFNGSPIELSLAARYLQSHYIASSKPTGLLELTQTRIPPSEIALTKLYEKSKSGSTSAAASSSASSSSSLLGMGESGTPFSWLRACSYFLPHQIPINWFKNWLEGYDSKSLESIQRELLRTGLLYCDDQSSTFFLSNVAQQKIGQFQPDRNSNLFLSNILLPFFASQTKDANWYSHAEALIKNNPPLTENPSWIEINFELGKQLLKQKDPLQAKIFLERALSGFNIMTSDESIKKTAFIRLALSQMELSAQKKQNKIQKEQLAIEETAKTEYLKDAPRRRALRAHQAAENAAQSAKTANASAIAQLNQAYELVKTIAQNNEKDQDLAIDLLLETGDIFQCVNNQQEALNCYSSALEKLLKKDETIENTKEIRLCHKKLAEVYFSLGQYNDAKTHFFNALKNS